MVIIGLMRLEGFILKLKVIICIYFSCIYIRFFVFYSFGFLVINDFLYYMREVFSRKKVF